MMSVTEYETIPVRRWNPDAQAMEDTGSTRTQLKMGTVVRVVDEVGVAHLGLVTSVHGPECINAVYVSADESKHDPYGRQVERLCSLQARSEFTAAGGRYYEPL